MKFKTNAKCTGCSATICGAVRRIFPDATLNLDLASPDRILSVSGIPEDAESADRIVAAIASVGFSASAAGE